jgi:hypothetical protein
MIVIPQNDIFLQLENEKAQLAADKISAEQERFGLREELLRVEQEKMDIETEKTGNLLVHLLIRTMESVYPETG